MTPLAARRPDDQALLRRAAAGDAAAAAAIDARYRRRLTRYARGLLGRSEHDAEDVVQDVLLRVHVELHAGRGPAELRPWLYRLTRNAAIDELRRARRGDASLDAAVEDGAAARGAYAEDDRDAPEVVMGRRQAVRELVSDLADLPMNQRTALLAREVDGEPTSRIGERLGISTEAAQMLIVRARANLVRARDARDDRALDHGLRALAPPVGLLAAFGIGPFALGKAGVVAIGAGAAVAVAAVAGASVVASQGVHVQRTTAPVAGQPSPMRIFSAQRISRVRRGQPLPPGTSLVTATVRLHRGEAAPKGGRTLTLTCPADARFVSVVEHENPHLGVGWGLRPIPEAGVSRGATFHLGATDRRTGYGSFAIICRHHDEPAALLKAVSALTPAAAGTTPWLRRPPILERIVRVPEGAGGHRGDLWITLRLTGAPATDAGGDALFADLGDGDVHRLTDADFSTEHGHCFEYRATRRITHWRPGLRLPLRIWIGDGHGHATLVRRTLTVPRPARARRHDDSYEHPEDSATGRLGCWSPHL